MNVGVIGCGWAGDQHARAYSSLRNVGLLAVADVNEERARDLARGMGILGLASRLQKDS